MKRTGTPCSTVDCRTFERKVPCLSEFVAKTEALCYCRYAAAPVQTAVSVDVRVSCEIRLGAVCQLYDEAVPAKPSVDRAVILLSIFRFIHLDARLHL